MKLSNLLLSAPRGVGGGARHSQRRGTAAHRRFHGDRCHIREPPVVRDRHDLQHRDDRHRRNGHVQLSQPARRCTTPRSRLPRSRHPAPPRWARRSPPRRRRRARRGPPRAASTPLAPTRSSARSTRTCARRSSSRPTARGGSAGGVVPATLSLTLAAIGRPRPLPARRRGRLHRDDAGDGHQQRGRRDPDRQRPEPDRDRPPRQRHLRDGPAAAGQGHERRQSRHGVRAARDARDPAHLARPGRAATACS